MPKERNPRAKTPNPRADESVSTLVALPTPEEIAELLRRRPVHAVLIDICSDLGIVTADPMWIELRCALVVVTFNRDVRQADPHHQFLPAGHADDTAGTAAKAGTTFGTGRRGPNRATLNRPHRQSKHNPTGPADGGPAVSVRRQ